MALGKSCGLFRVAYVTCAAPRRRLVKVKLPMCPRIRLVSSPDDFLPTTFFSLRFSPFLSTNITSRRPPLYASPTLLKNHSSPKSYHGSEPDAVGTRKPAWSLCPFYYPPPPRACLVPSRRPPHHSAISRLHEAHAQAQQARAAQQGQAQQAHAAQAAAEQRARAAQAAPAPKAAPQQPAKPSQNAERRKDDKPSR